MGHHGARATAKIMQSYGFRWMNMHQDIQDFVKRCVHCQIHNANTHPHRGQRFLLLASRPFERISIDAIGPLEDDPEYSYIVTFLCHTSTSRFVRLYAVRSLEAKFSNSRTIHTPVSAGVPILRQPWAIH